MKLLKKFPKKSLKKPKQFLKNYSKFRGKIPEGIFGGNSYRSHERFSGGLFRGTSGGNFEEILERTCGGHIPWKIF